MSVILTRSGTQATIKDSDGKGGLCIALNQPKGSTARWKFSVRAHTDEGMFAIGEFTTCPPNKNRLSRIVAIANCPGATSWSLMCNLIAGESDEATLSMAVGYMTSGPGITRVAERYKQYEDAAPGVVNILPGEVVLGWTATSTAGGTVTIDGFGVITIPAGGSITGGGGGLIEGPETFTFSAGIDSYFIEVAESA